MAESQRKVEFSRPEETPRPHPLASELTEQELRKTRADRRENNAAARTGGGLQTASRGQRKVATRLLLYGLLLLGLAIILTMVITGFWNWTLFFLGLAIILCYMILVSAPFWLASSTKIAQDEAAKDVIEKSPERADRAPERTVDAQRETARR